ncbi:MAG: hypothetical protein JXA82_11610 [Sedimentisphaerales bacterium]|nr:hypothetical protein [Sedimentisphaerales bacterium]
MRIVRNSLAVLFLAALLFGGCRMVDEPIVVDNMMGTRVSVPAEPVVVVDQTDPTLENRFIETEQTNHSAVDSALMWSQKYDELLRKNEGLMEKNRQLFLENSDLQQKQVKLQADLDKTRMELEDANSFLQEMHAELTKWKTDVLGFRNEMRDAQTAQLQALGKVLQILGAEPLSGSTTQVAKNTSASSDQ